MSNDFYDISAKMKKLFPSNPQADLAALQQMANAPAEAVPTADYINESATVKKGSMPLDMDLSSFTRLAGINESQAKDAINTQPAGTTGNPTQDRLVGEESWKDLMGKAKPVEMPDLGPGGTSAQIEDLADRISKIEQWIADRIDGTMRKVEGKSPHKKGTKKYNAHMAAMHAEGSSNKNSIKEELFRKLAASKK
jgi:hypothetical protein